MPRPQPVPVSGTPSCEHRSLAACEVCGGAEATLTTDCPGTTIDAERLQELAETTLDYTDERGWHLATSDRSPRFAAPCPAEARRVDQRAGIAPRIDWAAVDLTAELQHVLTQKAIAWVLADRACEDQSARLASATGAAKSRLRGALDEQARALATLESAKIDFHVACRRVETCEEEFKQAARVLVTSLEERSMVETTAETPEGAAS